MRREITARNLLILRSTTRSKLVLFFNTHGIFRQSLKVVSWRRRLGLHLAGDVVRNTVLIVEDNASLRDAPCERFKRKRDFAVRGVAENGPETIEVAGRQDPDLIGLDLLMPEMNGLDVPLILYSCPRPEPFRASRN